MSCSQLLIHFGFSFHILYLILEYSNIPIFSNLPVSLYHLSCLTLLIFHHHCMTCSSYARFYPSELCNCAAVSVYSCTGHRWRQNMFNSSQPVGAWDYSYFLSISSVHLYREIVIDKTGFEPCTFHLYLVTAYKIQHLNLLQVLVISETKWSSVLIIASHTAIPPNMSLHFLPVTPKAV